MKYTVCQRVHMYFIKGKWQYKFLFSHLKELLKLYINLFYRFFISSSVLEIFSLEASNEMSAILDTFLISLTVVLVTSQQGLTI